MAGFAHVDPTYILLGTAMLAGVPEAFLALSIGVMTAPDKPMPAGKLDALLDAANELEVQSVTVSQHDRWTAVHLTAKQEDGSDGVERFATELGAAVPVRRSNATHDWLATSVSPDESLAIMITGDWRTR